MSVVTEGSVIYYPGYGQRQVQQNIIIQQIAAITNAVQMQVTTTNPNFYHISQKVTFSIPSIFGTRELNTISGVIIQVISDSIFITDIDSSYLTPFAYPITLPQAYSLPYVVPYSSGPQIPPTIPLPDQNSFYGTVYNNGQFP